ncbi:MAG: M48 family metallopeptidase [Gammaproteobacteria bacterium]|nr:M48 family metallopeptidase [Gammaproteobacteria bacterium]
MDIPFQIRRTGHRSRSISVRVHPDGTVRVGAPNWAAMRDIRQVVSEHSGWINERLEAVAAVMVRYEHGAEHLYLGRSYPLRIRLADAPPHVRLMRTGFAIQSRSDAESVLRDQLRRWYRGRAEVVIARRLERLVPNLSWLKGAPRWCLRRMRTQWGSCCETGLVTFNTQLVKAPLRLVDYVIVHELVHLKHHDHGRGFERLMDAQMPDWRRRRRELNELGERVLND